MAILKHFAVKNADYGAVIDYLKYQHDEFHLVPILDENGNSMLRDEFYFDGLNCNPEAFDLECELLNQQYHKNQRYGIQVKDHRGRFSYLTSDRQKYISARKLGSHYDREYLLQLFEENALAAEQNQAQWAQDDPITILFIKSDLRLVVDLQNCIKAQQSRAYAQKVKISNLQQMAKTVAYIQEHGYDTQKKLQDTTDTIQSKMAKARSDAKLTEAKLKKVNEQIHYLGQYLSTKSVYADFLKSTNKKDFRQNHADEIAKYEEALQFLKQNSPDGKLPTMKDLRSEKELLVQQKSAQYETYQYFRDYHRELQTVCENVNHILDASQTKQQEQKKSHQSEHSI